MSEQSKAATKRELGRFVFSLVLTGIIAGFTYGTGWASRWNSAALAGTVVYASLWFGAMWFVWVEDRRG